MLIYGINPVLEALKARREAALREKPAALRERLHKQFFAAYDRYLDNNREIQWLRIENQTRLDFAVQTFDCCRGQYAFRRAANADARMNVGARNRGRYAR